MRRLLLLGVCLNVLSAPAYADDITVSTDLAAVTVYTDRAALTRSVKVKIPQGKHTIIFEELPASLSSDSLRVEGEGDAKAVLGALSSKVVYEQKLVNEKEQALNDQLQGLQQKEKILRAEQRVLDTQKAFYENIVKQTSNRVEEEISVYEFNTDKWIGAANTLQKGLSENLQARFAIDDQLKALKEQILKVRNELNQVRSGRRSYYEVRLPVEMEEAGELNLELSYQQHGAYWRPVYDARLDTKTGELELVQYGSVTQNTGEDWTDIALTLSTARPHRGASAPDLFSMWVDSYDPEKAMRVSSVSNVRGGAVMDMAMPATLGKAEKADLYGEQEAMLSSVREVKKAAPQAAQIDTGGLTAEYIIPGPSSVKMDGSESKLFITSLEVDTELERHIKPQHSKNAYLVANMVLEGEDNTMLPGMVNLFRDNAFIGKTNVQLIRSGQDFGMSFGIDDQIEVERKILKDEKAQSGMFVGKTDVLERHYVTEIANLRSDAVNIVVEEIVPASRNENVILKLVPDATSKGYKMDADKVKGLVRWSFSLGAKNEEAVKLGWQLSWPQGQQITGLR